MASERQPLFGEWMRGCLIVTVIVAVLTAILAQLI